MTETVSPNVDQPIIDSSDYYNLTGNRLINEILENGAVRYNQKNPIEPGDDVYQVFLDIAVYLLSKKISSVDLLGKLSAKLKNLPENLRLSSNELQDIKKNAYKIRELSQIIESDDSQKLIPHQRSSG